jgi:hypothetical protein
MERVMEGDPWLYGRGEMERVLQAPGVRSGMRDSVAGLLIAVTFVLTFFSIPPQPAMAQSALPKTWYFAEGTTREGFFEYISLQNPEPNVAHVTITYMTNGGPIGPFVHDIQARSRETVYVNGFLDPGLDVSVKVESDRGLVAERPMYFSYKGAWNGGSVVTGVTAPSKQWYFAEGTTRPGFEEWLCIQNPQDVELSVKVHYYTPTEVQEKSYIVPARYRFTIDVNGEAALFWPQEPHQDVSLKVEADLGIIAERPMYFKYMNDWDGGDTAVGVTQPGKEWYLAEGYCQWNFDTWLCFLNPDLPTAKVTVNYRRGDGALLPAQEVEVPGLSRRTIYVNDVVGKGEFSFQITSDRDIVVERPMYFSYKYIWAGGHNNTAIASASGNWYLAEGATHTGIETYLCVLNPVSTDQTVMVEYMMEKGANKNVEFVVPAYSRYTRNVNSDVGPGHDVSFRVKAIKNNPTMDVGEIVVERPMYFLYGGTLAGGHVASGYPAD